MAGDLPESGVELVAKNAAAFVASMADANKSVESFEKTTANAATGITKSGSIMDGVFQGIGQGIAGIAADSAAALGGFVKDSISAAGDFEGGMNNFAVAAGGALDKAGLKVEEFSDLFLDMGKRLPVSTMDVQEAATTLVKGGLDPLILKAGGLESSLNFAAAAGMDLNKAAELSIKQLATFGDANATAAEQSAFLAESQELMVKAAGASTLDVGALGDAMLTAAGQAKAAGVDQADFITTMGLISPAFGSAAEAGTAYKNFLARLQPSSAAAAESMAELGLLTDEGASKFYDANGAFIGNQAAAELLQGSLAGLSDAQKSQALQTIFGNDAMGAAIALADSGEEGYAKFAESMEQASGVQETAAGKQKGFNSAFDNFMGTVEAVQISLGTKFLPILADLFNKYISPGVTLIGDLVGKLLDSGGAFEGLMPDVSGVGKLFGDLGDIVGGLAAKYLPMLQATWERDLMPAIQEGQRFFNEDLMPILSDLGATILPILGTAIDVLAAAWSNVLVPAIKVAWGIFDQFLLPVIKVVVSWLKEYLPPAIDIVAGFFTGTLLPAIGSIYGFIDTKLLPAGRILVDFFEDTLGGAVKAVAGGFNGIGEAIGGLISWFSPLQDGFNALKVPDVLTPGSPTPFEMGLRGIDSALSDTTPKVDDLGKAMGDLGKAAPGNVAPELSPEDVEYFTVTFRQLTTTVGAFVDLWSKDLVPSIKWAVGEMDQGVGHLAGVMIGAFDGIRHAVNVAADGFLRLGDTIRALPPPPPVFTPGSPTPFEEGMWGIHKAMGAVIPDFGLMAGSMQGLERVTPDAMPGMGSSSVTNVYNGGNRSITMPVYTNNSPAIVQQSMAYYAALEGGTV